MKHLSFTYSIWGTVYQISSPPVHVNFILSKTFASDDVCYPKVKAY